MFQDSAWLDDSQQRDRYRAWLQAVADEAEFRRHEIGAERMSAASAVDLELTRVMILERVDRAWLGEEAPAASDIEDLPFEEALQPPVPFYRAWLRAKLERLFAMKIGAAPPLRPATDPLKFCVLEIGCGQNVATVRWNSQMTLMKLLSAGARCSIVRINPENPGMEDPLLGFGESLEVSIIQGKGLECLRIIDELIPQWK